MNERSADQWRKLIRAYSYGLSASQQEQVVEACLKNPTWGVWHASSQVFGTKCHCAPCADRRKL